MRNYCNAYAEIDRAVLRSNYKKIKEAASTSEIIAVVKADAYGHGDRECSRIFYECGCRFFAVATVDEALGMRELYPDCEILILGICPFDAADVLADSNIIAALGSIEHARMLKSNLSSGKTLRCHLKLDTGMNRIGFSSREEDFGIIEEAFSIDGLEVEGMFSHFACSDMPESSMTDEQFARFVNVEKHLKRKGIQLKVRHISNSAATLYRPDTHLDYVRCGIILYGLDPSSDRPAAGLTPAMTFKSHITHIHSIRKGETVGYGADFTADRDMKIATLPIGYADGFIRAYAKGGFMVLSGKRCPIVGRICMDQCMIDVTDAEAVPGDEVTIFGPDISVNNLADAAGTINYECVCLLSRRVKRIYIN